MPPTPHPTSPPSARATRRNKARPKPLYPSNEGKRKRQREAQRRTRRWVWNEGEGDFEDG